MAKKLSSVLGIDVGTQKIKIAEIKMQGREPAITALGMTDTPQGAADNTGVYDSDSIGAALKDLIANSGVSVSDCVISVSGQASVLVRTLEVPKMSASELKDHMQWEVSRSSPFAESTLVSDYGIISEGAPDDQNMEVVMAISPQSAIDTLIAVIKKAGKKPAAIDVEPLALGRSLAVSYDGEFGSETVCMVEVGHVTTWINMYKDGKLVMPRNVPIGGEMFTRALADNLMVSFDEAESLKVERVVIPESASLVGTGGGMGGGADAITSYNPFGDDQYGADPGYTAPPPEDAPGVTASFEQMTGMDMPAPEPTPSAAPASMTAEEEEVTRMFNALAMPLEEFVTEIRRSIDYFRGKGGDVSRIELLGGGSKIRGLATFLEKALGIKCALYDPMRNLSLAGKRLDAQDVDRNRTEYAVAIGNGLHIAFD